MVEVYQNCTKDPGERGGSARFGVGKFNTDSPGFMADASYIVVPSGYKATIYNNKDYTGQSIVIGSGQELNYCSTSWANDGVRSMKIEDLSNAGSAGSAQEWTKVLDLPFAKNYYYSPSIAMSSNGAIIYVLDHHGKIYKNKGSLTTWEPTGDVPDYACSIACSADGQICAINAQVGGGFYISKNGCASWTKSSSPVNPYLQGGICMSADGNYIYSGSVGSSPVLYSNNGGTSYSSATLSEPGDAHWTSTCCSSDGKIAYASSFYKGIIMTSDGGASWSTTSAPKECWRSLACSGDGKTIYAGGDRVLYISNDTGGSWEKVPVGDGTARHANCVSCSGDGKVVVAYVAPDSQDSVSVYVSTDGGSNWDTTISLANGYPVFISRDGSTMIGKAPAGLYASTRKVEVKKAAPVAAAAAAAPAAAPAATTGSTSTLSGPGWSF